jgi:hypothetical protein
MTKSMLLPVQVSPTSAVKDVMPHVLSLLTTLSKVTKSTIISKGFAGRYGRGYLCHDVTNVVLGPIQERNLLTGKCLMNGGNGRNAYRSRFELQYL